jgi:hypothetical protein
MTRKNPKNIAASVRQRLRFGDSSPERLAGVFRSLCELQVPDDGLSFSKGERISEEVGAGRAVAAGVIWRWLGQLGRGDREILGLRDDRQGAIVGA